MKRPPAPARLAALLGVVAVGIGAGVSHAAADPPPDGCPAPCGAGASTLPGGIPGAAQLRARGWRSSPEVASLLSRVRQMNVLLVVVDALRAEPFRDPAASAQRFPHLAALRQRARWFTNAFAPAAGTDLSMGGVLTGSLDPMAGADFTLPELLGAAGLVSHAVVPREVVRATSKTLMTRGLRRPDIVVTDPWKPNVPAAVSAYRITNLGLSFVDRWLSGSPPDGREPFFLWLHYFDLHEHHQLPDDLPRILAHNEGRPAADRAEKYHALLSVTDEALGRLFEGLARRGLTDNTIVVFASDHGESLKEDRRLPDNHGRVLYNPLVHVPLAIAIPGVEGGDDPQPASLLDVPITLLDLLGVRVPPSMDTGQTLLPNLARIPPIEDHPRTFILNESDQFAVIQWPYKILVRRRSAAAELYDLSRDFAESINLASQLPQVVRALSRAYRDLPAITLDRTRAGRRRFEELSRLTRPRPDALSKMAARRGPPASAAR
jgi:hypothetical protein